MGVTDHFENFAEGDYAHHRENKNLKPVFDELERIADAFEDVLNKNERIGHKILFDLGFQTKRRSPGVYTKQYNFKPTTGIMAKAFKISPLQCTISISTEKSGDRNKCGFFRRGNDFSTIDVAYRLDTFSVNRYNAAIDAFKIGGDRYLQELQRSKKAIQYAICKQATRSIFLHELTHWLDSVFDYGLFEKRKEDSTQTYHDEWLFYEHEFNAIVHQIKYLKKSLPGKLWNKLSLIDLMILIQIPKIFIKKALINHIDSYQKKTGVIRGFDDTKLALIKDKLAKGLISTSGEDWFTKIAQQMRDHRIYGKMILKGINLDFYALDKEMLYSRDHYLDHYLMITREPEKYIDYINFYRDQPKQP